MKKVSVGKLVSSLLMIAMLSTALCPVTMASGTTDLDEQLSKYVFVDTYAELDFTEGADIKEVRNSTPNTAGGNYVFHPAKTDIATIETYDADHGPSAKFTKSGNQLKGYYPKGGLEYGIVRYEGDYLFKDFNGEKSIIKPYYLATRMPSWATGKGFVVKNNGTKNVISANGVEMDAAVDTWYKLTVLIDVERQAEYYYVDGTLLTVADFSHIPVVAGYTSAKNTRASVDSSEASTWYLDNFLVATYANYSEVVSATSNADNTVVSVKVSDHLAASDVTKDTVKIFCGEKEVEVDNVKYIAADRDREILKTIEITPRRALASAVKYRVELSSDITTQAGGTVSATKNSVEFTTTAEDYDITNITFASGKVTATVKNDTAGAVDTMMVVLVKDSTGRIIACKYSDVTPIAVGGDTIEVPVTAAGASECEVFFLDGWTNRFSAKAHVFYVPYGI